MLYMQVARRAVQPRAADGGAMSTPWQDCSRREVVLGGMSSIAAARVLSASAASASTQAPVTPVNITPKETMELGKSGAGTAVQPLKVVLFTARRRCACMHVNTLMHSVCLCILHAAAAGLKITPLGIGAAWLSAFVTEAL